MLLRLLKRMNTCYDFHEWEKAYLLIIAIYIYNTVKELYFQRIHSDLNYSEIFLKAKGLPQLIMW